MRYSKRSSNSSTEVEGNTNPTSSPKKQISPSKMWCFTLNNYTKEEYSSIISIIKETCKYGIIGKEIGECGTPHLQGYIKFKIKKRPLSVFSNKRIHWEKCKGSQSENIEYCKKDNDYIIIDPEIEDMDLITYDKMYLWQRDILNIIDTKPDKRSIHWYWSENGGVGKTEIQKWLCINKGAIMLSGKASDVRNGIIQYKKEYDRTPRLILYNIPRSFNKEYLSYESLENIKDMCFYSGKFEGGMICGPCPHLFVFANCLPEIEKLSIDRWIIKEITDEDCLTFF